MDLFFHILSPPLVRAAGIFRKYAGGTLWDTLSRAFPPPVYYMTKYEYLLSKKENGELSMLFELGLPVHLSGWMEYYEYHLEHSQKSQWQVSLAFRVSKGTVWNAYRFLFDFASKVEQPPTILWSFMSQKSSTFVVGIGDQ